MSASEVPWPDIGDGPKPASPSSDPSRRPARHFDLAHLVEIEVVGVARSLHQTLGLPTHSGIATLQQRLLGGLVTEVDFHRCTAEHQHGLGALIAAHGEHAHGPARLVVEHSLVGEPEQVVDGEDRQVCAEVMREPVFRTERVTNVGVVTSLTAKAASFFSRRVGVKGQSSP